MLHFLTIITSGIAAILAALLCILLYSFLQNIIPLANPQPSQYLTGLILPAAIMGILISSFTLEVMDNSKATDLINNETELPEKAVEKHSFPGLAVRQGTRHTIVAYPDIVFIQARGKRSVIHTETEQFVAAKLLREFLPSLPPALFLRIHRGYIVNLKWIREMEYDIGGSYIARLKDEDETELPVSRDTANLLKINLGIATKKNLYTNS